jgi:hypothetical protein
MAGVKLMAAVCALTLMGLATAAHADPLITDPSKALADRNQWAPPDVHSSYEWNASKSSWGLKLDLNQPGARDMDLRDVQAGAYFKLTPTLRVGGAVTLGDPNASVPRDAPPQPPPPRVRLETALKF